MGFINGRHDAPQRQGRSNSHGDKGERDLSSETSEGNLEAGLVGEQPNLARRITNHARERIRTLANWIATQRRSVHAVIATAGAGLAIILILLALLIHTNIHLRRQIPHNDIQRILASWGTPGSPTEGQARYPSDFSGDIVPIPCHSHNDYGRRVPLYGALAAGCTGVEADVWLGDDEGEELLVGHTRGALTGARTLRSLYIDPLVSILAQQNPSRHANTTTTTNGVFTTDPTASLTLLIDIKTDGRTTLPIISLALEPLRSRGYLSYWNGTAIIQGAVTVIGTGNTPFELLQQGRNSSSSKYRDIFYDAPLSQLWGETAPSNASAYSIANSDYASVDFAAAVGPLWHGRMAPGQVETVRGQVREARRRGLRARYWNTPGWPVGVREHVWDVLVKEGVGMLNVDDLEGARGRNWNLGG